MKSKAQILTVGAIFVLFAIFSFACQSDHGTTPIAPTVVTHYFDGTYHHFKPSAVTITAGSSVLWDSSFGFFHTLDIDDGASNCVTDYFSYPITITFNNPGTYNYHCDYHSSCGAGNCTNCTGMVGSVLVK